MSKFPKAAIAPFLGGMIIMGLLALLIAPANESVPPAGAELRLPEKSQVGRGAKPEEIAGWDIDIRPDGAGLPAGSGTVRAGETLYNEQCASCHGEFGESAGRWPMLAGGDGSLATHDPVKTVGSYWPYASTLMDYIRRAMPYGNAQSLSNDELYAVTAYVLYLNNVIEDEEFELNQKNFAAIKMPNAAKFIGDDREVAEKQFWQAPCMTNCAPGEARITGRASVIDVTPEAGKAPKVE